MKTEEQQSADGHAEEECDDGDNHIIQSKT